MKHLILFAFLLCSTFLFGQQDNQIKIDPSMSKDTVWVMLSDTNSSSVYYGRGMFYSWASLTSGLASYINGLDTAYVNSGDSLVLVIAGDTTFFEGGSGSGLTDGDKGDISVTGTGLVWNIDTGVVGDNELSNGLNVTQLADGSVNNTEFQYINSVTSNVQTQLNGKLSTEVDGDPTNEIQGIDNVLSQSEPLTANRTIDQQNRELYFDSYVDEGDNIHFRSKLSNGLGGAKIDIGTLANGQSMIKGYLDASSSAFLLGTDGLYTFGGDPTFGNSFYIDNPGGNAILDNFAHDYHFGINQGSVGNISFSVNGDVRFNDSTLDNFFEFTGSAETALFYSTGQDFKLGINNPSPTVALDVVGDMALSGSVSAGGAISGSNFGGSSFGTNTGDQDLSGYSLLGHTHTFASLTSKPTTIAGYGITDFNSLGDARWSLLAHTHTFASLTSIPTTIAGYGITDFNSLGDARWIQLTQNFGGDVSGVYSNIQLGTAVVGDTELGSGLDATQLADGTVTSSEFQFINTLSSNAQTQLTGKATLAGIVGGQTLIGGTGTTDDLILQSTSGVGATGALIQMKVGNNGGTTAMTILNNGNIGLGASATSPVHLLQIGSVAGAGSGDVFNASATGATMSLKATSSSGYSGLNIYDNSNVLSASFAYGNPSAGVFNDQYFIGARKTTTPIVFTTNIGGTDAERIRIQPSGRLGIATSAPDGLLEVNLGTADAFRLSYNDSNGSAAVYKDETISSTGVVTNNAVGSSSSFVFSDPFANTATSLTLGAAAATFALTSNVMTITGNGGGNTLTTITGGFSGQILTLIFADANVTITDDAAGTANTINIGAAFTSTANDVLTLVHNGTSWRECSRSAN